MAKKYSVFFGGGGGDENVLKSTAMMVTQFYEYSKNHYGMVWYVNYISNN